MGRGLQSKGAGRGLDGGRGFGFGGFGGAGATSSLSYLTEPPSFNAVSDPNVVVIFKNVLKKDSTTKAKALDDLVSYVQARPFEKDGGVEDAVLDVWDEIYPRTAIDNSRRVRELSHTLQFELLKSARKRMERHIPNIVGAWLAGLYDRDRVVSKAANDGLASLLTTPEKVAGFWKRCHSQILTYATEAIQETQDTLSDERSTTKEDSEAKYYRVINSSLSLVLSLLQRTPAEDLTKLQSDYDNYFAQDSVWKAITIEDSSVRRSVCQLLVVCLQKKLPYADAVECRQAIITGGLKTAQSGSALDYVDALAKLTEVYPSIWSPSAKTKKSPVARLQAFIAKGSQGSRATFWEALDKLLTLLPADALEEEYDSLLLESIQKGISNREEPRMNSAAAWKCYTNAASRAIGRLSDEASVRLASEHLLPLIQHYLYPTAGKQTIGAGAPQLGALKDIYLVATQTPSTSDLSTEEWKRFGDVLCTKLSGSLPGVSKEYQSSQEKVAEEGKRWFSLTQEINKTINSSQSATTDRTIEPSAKIILQAIALLESRNMKPFGAARLIEHALRLSPHLFVDNVASRTVEFLLFAAQEEMDKVVESPSLPILLSCTNFAQSIPTTQSRTKDIWAAWVDHALNLKPGKERNTILATIVSHNDASNFVQNHEGLQHEIGAQGLQLAKSASNDWELFQASVNHSGITKNKSRALSQEVSQILAAEASESALSVLEMLIRSMPELLAENDELHTTLVARLLSLTEISNGPLSSKAANIRSLLDTHADGKLPVVGIVQSNLEEANGQSLETDTLVSQAKAACRNEVQLEDVFPSTNVWMQEISPFLDLPINPSLSITNIIGGAATLDIGEAGYHGTSPPVRVARDKKGRSVPARMALYTCLMTEKDVDITTLPTQFVVELLYLQCVTAQLISDQITSLDTNGLWLSLGRTEDFQEAENLVSKLRSQMNQLVTSFEWWTGEAESGASAVVNGLVNLLMQESESVSPRGVYSSRALSELFQTVAESSGVNQAIEDRFFKLEYLKTAPNVALVAAALVAGFGQSLQASKTINNFCNRLVSDAAGATIDGARTRTVLALITLCSSIYEQGQLPVANNRIVFAVRQISSFLEEPELLDARLSAEVCRALTVLLPCMKDVYGSYWEKTVEFLLHLWDRAREHPAEEAIPVIHASLKLSKVLENIEDANDDLVDALKDLQKAKPKAMVELLKLPREFASQPASIVDAMLCREVNRINVRDIPAVDEIFPLIASEARDIQTAAYSLLHRAIPEEQQQKSVDALLDKTDARLPDELLSLLLDPPTLEAYSDEALAQFPIAIRCYLLSWKLIFDAFSTSSFKVKNDFTDHLKSENYVTPLLDFVFDVLGHSAASPLNLDRENFPASSIFDYDLQLADAEEDERNMQWLLLHLYYLVLKYVPGLFRTWYLDCRSKQTRLAVESWTTKYYSPLIVGEALDEVQKWADTQEPPAADEQELLVKVSKAAREVTAGYEVDESHATIVIKVPASYPIEGVTVSGLHRVAVSESKWKSWIMTTQGVITFSNGNIIDGLQVFKRNIVGALKGQSECAICYSIISTDKRMPDKRCTTCKNFFHRTCLYKWFQTSNQNTCPLCRNPIDYLGADTAKRRQ